MKKGIIGIILATTLILGICVGALAKDAVVPSAKANTAQRWDYMCINTMGMGIGAYIKALQGHGANGWEVAVKEEVMTCFKKPL